MGWVLVAALATPLLVGHPVLSAGEPEQPQFLSAWGKKGDKPGEFYSPIHIAINTKDEVYVADLNNARVQKFTTEGNYLGGFDLPLDAPPRKSCIVGGLAVDDRGQLYLSFMNQHKVGVYSDAGKVVREWGQRGNRDGEFNQPGVIVWRPDGTLYLTDQCNHRVQKFTTDGKFLAKWGEHGSAPGQFGGAEPAGSRFAGPHFLAQDSRGRLYTTEASLGRVQQFTPEGKALSAWGDKGDQPGGFGALKFGGLKTGFGPIGLLVDRHDRVWVSSLNDRVQCFTPEGKYLFGIGGSGREPGQFAHPHGMAVDSKGRLYVADAGNQRIQKFAIPDP
jgi:DNA-binding beta-propeller fold protein YncE